MRVVMALLFVLLHVHATVEGTQRTTWTKEETKKPTLGPETRGQGLTSFFRALDEDGDGQIEEEEARLYIKDVVGGDDFDTRNEVEEGARSIIKNLDSADIGDTVDESELAQHLQRLLTNEKVVDWVVHGLNLPQYEEHVRNSAITALDFPLLVSNDSILGEELGVKSAIHKSQVLRGMRRQILGLGRVPSAPQHLDCVAKEPGNMVLVWEQPRDVGSPPVHSYILQRKEAGSMVWNHVAKIPHTSLVHVDDQSILPEHTYIYRIVAWGGHGHSDFGTSNECRALSYPVDQTEGLTRMITSTFFSLHWQTMATLLVVVGGLLQYLGTVTMVRRLRKTWRKVEGSKEQSGSKESNPNKIAPSSKDKCSVAVLGNGQDGVPCALEADRCVLGPAGRSYEFEDDNGSRSKDEDRTREIDGVDVDTSSPGTSWGDPNDGVVPLSRADIAASEGYREAYGEVRLNRCNFPGCHERWDRWYRIEDVLMRFKRHYCAGCQNVFCYKHTRISPHGTSGRCSLESKCYCEDCFNQMPHVRQVDLERTNKLPWAKLPSGPGGEARQRWQQVVLGAQWRPGDRPPSTDSAYALSTTPAAALRWRAAGSKLQAIQAFRSAGHTRRNRRPSDLPSDR